MKKLWLVLLLFFAMTGIASADVDVHNHSLKKSYVFGDLISGEINLTITSENYNSKLRSDDGSSITLGEFLDRQLSMEEICSPSDCSADYNSSLPSEDKMFKVNSTTTYGGFVLNGLDVNLTHMSFSMGSNFGLSTKMPLSIKYFDKGSWAFNDFGDFSTEEFSSKSWGCFNHSGSYYVGDRIGQAPYCEMIYFSETGGVEVGVWVEGTDAKEIKMTLYSDYGAELGSCLYNPGSKDECYIAPGEVFNPGYYQVCVSAEDLTEFRIYEETSEPTCGFSYSYGPESSTKDYAIFDRSAMYNDATSFGSENVFVDSEGDFDDFEKAILLANELLEKRYDFGDCSNGCILPLAFSGISQNLRIYDVNLVYIAGGANKEEKNIHNLEIIPATVDFSGVLDLSSTGFNVSKSENYSLYLEGELLFSEDIEILPVPIIDSLSPTNPPAGVPVSFYVSVDYPVPNASLTYKWKFGNDSVITTTENSVVYIFDEVRNYNVSVEVSAGENLNSEKSFVINAISPMEAVNVSLSQKNDALDNMIQKMNDLPDWYKEDISNIINISFYDNELNRLERERDDAIDDKDILKVAKELYALDIPIDIFADEATYPFLINSISDINPQIIRTIVGGSVQENLDGYKNPILRWQTQNAEVSYSTKMYSVSRWHGDVTPMFRVYSFSVSLSGDDEGYFVINRPREELHFNRLSRVQDANGSTVIIFDSGESKNFEFYYESSDETTFFVSPKLSSIVLEADIDVTCNYNGICEEELGENPDNCRPDCKPVASAIIYMVFVIIFALILYTALQIWYKKRYEHYLFKDPRELYNVVMFITNARANGQSDGVIVATLRKRGWFGEKINYVIKKSRGRMTGLPEIIPIERIAAYLRNRKARNASKGVTPANKAHANAGRGGRIATGIQQQSGRNINKSVFRKRV